MCVLRHNGASKKFGSLKSYSIILTLVFILNPPKKYETLQSVKKVTKGAGWEAGTHLLSPII